MESHVGDLEVIISFPSTDDHNNGQIEDELDCCMKVCSVHKTLRKLLHLVGTEGRGLVSSDLDYFGGAQSVRRMNYLFGKPQCCIDQK